MHNKAGVEVVQPREQAQHDALDAALAEAQGGANAAAAAVALHGTKFVTLFEGLQQRRHVVFAILKDQVDIVMVCADDNIVEFDNVWMGNALQDANLADGGGRKAVGPLVMQNDALKRIDLVEATVPGAEDGPVGALADALELAEVGHRVASSVDTAGSTYASVFFGSCGGGG